MEQQNLGEAWRRVGSFRNSDKNMGSDWLRVGVALKQLLDDARYQVEHGSFSPMNLSSASAIAASPSIHFPMATDARLIADLLAMRLGRPRFTWGSATLVNANETRQRYLAALQAADARVIAPLLAIPRD